MVDRDNSDRGGSHASGPLMSAAAPLSREQALDRLFVLGERLEREGRLLMDQVASVRGELNRLLAELGRLQEALRE